MEHEKIILARIIDRVKQYQNTGKTTNTNFLDPLEQENVDNILKNINHIFFGGYEDAERKILFIGEEPNYNKVEIIRIESNDKLEHRSVLGSILGLGLKREMIGDILVNENKCDIIIISDIEKFVLSNFKKIGKENIKISIKNINELKVLKNEPKIIKTTIASLRLDAVIANGFSLSREMAAEIIKNEKVKLNYKVTNNNSKQIKINDKISIRGYGRLEITDILGETSKNRIRVVMNKI